MPPTAFNALLSVMAHPHLWRYPIGTQTWYGEISQAHSGGCCDVSLLWPEAVMEQAGQPAGGKYRETGLGAADQEVSPLQVAVNPIRGCFSICQWNPLCWPAKTRASTMARSRSVGGFVNAGNIRTVGQDDLVCIQNFHDEDSPGFGCFATECDQELPVVFGQSCGRCRGSAIRNKGAQKGSLCRVFGHKHPIEFFHSKSVGGYQSDTFWIEARGWRGPFP